MADCKICGEAFYPKAEELLLIASGDIEEICLECAMAKVDREQEAAGDTWRPVAPLTPREKISGFNKLVRVEMMDSEGDLSRFLSVRPNPLVPTYPTLRKDKPYDLHVEVIGPKRGLSRGEHEPEVYVNTNLDSFSRTGQDFWAKKTPSFVCPMTGVDEIRVRRKDILCIVNEAPGLRVVRLKDGRQVNLRYK